MMKDEPEILFVGDHLSFRRRRGWEYVEHRKAPEAVMIVAVTADHELVLADEFRPAVGARVISLPAGLVGDVDPEEQETAARRELREETGYAAADFKVLGRGPGSAGASSEIVTFFFAPEARLVGEQAPEDRQIIRVHTVALSRVLAWSRRREAQGALIDPKIWAGLYLSAAAEAPGRRRVARPVRDSGGP
jgi:ADP-ribose pyrophosphatase